MEICARLELCHSVSVRGWSVIDGLGIVCFSISGTEAPALA